MQKNYFRQIKPLLVLNSIKLLRLSCLLCFFVNFATRQSTKELTRPQAQSLIIESAEWKHPATVSLATRYENPAEALRMNKASDSEEVEEGKVRNLVLFFEYFPQIGVANHLGLVTIEQVLVKEEKANLIVGSSQWYFTVKVRANDKGKALWKDYGLPPNDEAIPLAKKQFVGITGITKLAENQVKADFTWKWIPNQIAKFLQPDTDEFKSLPAELQKAMLGKSPNNYQPKTEDWSGERNAAGIVQRYDDGWRLVRFW